MAHHKGPKAGRGSVLRGPSRLQPDDTHSVDISNGNLPFKPTLLIKMQATSHPPLAFWESGKVLSFFVSVHSLADFLSTTVFYIPKGTTTRPNHTVVRGSQFSVKSWLTKK